MYQARERWTKVSRWYAVCISRIEVQHSYSYQIDRWQTITMLAKSLEYGRQPVRSALPFLQCAGLLYTHMHYLPRSPESCAKGAIELSFWWNLDLNISQHFPIWAAQNFWRYLLPASVPAVEKCWRDLHQRVSLSIALEIVFQLFVLFSSSMPTVDTLSLNLFTVWSWSEKVETSMQLSSVHIREDLSRLVSRHPQHIAWWITMCAWPRQAWVVDYAVDVLNVFGLNSSQAGMTQITTFKWEQTNQLHIVPSQVRSTSLFHCVGFCVIPHGGVGYNFPIS